MPFLIFSNKLLQNAYIVCQKTVDIFLIVHKTCSILVGGAVPPKVHLILSSLTMKMPQTRRVGAATRPSLNY